MLGTKWSRAYDLDRSDIRDLPEEAQGVYRIWRFKSLSEPPVVIYVGQGRLGECLMGHLSREEENPCIRHVRSKRKCWFDHCIIDDPADMERVAREEIRRLDPSCNRPRRG